MTPEFDKYAPYIWWCYGITAFVLIAILVLSIARAGRVKRELDSLDGQRRRAPFGAEIMMRWVPLAAFAVLAIGLFWGLFREDRDTLRSTRLDKPTPAFTLPSLADPETEITEAVFLGDGPVILNFWATWCGPCQVEHPKLMELSKLPGVRVIGINYDQKPKEALDFLKNKGDPFSAVGFEKNRKVWIDYGVAALPESFVISGDGTIVYKHVGPINPGDIEKKFLPAIKRLQSKRGSSQN